jgi:hypothetical protein
MLRPGIEPGSQYTPSLKVQPNLVATQRNTLCYHCTTSNFMTASHSMRDLRKHSLCQSTVL